MLFRPFIKLRFLASAISPADVCVQAADNICSLVETYRRTYALHYTPAFVPYILLASSITHLFIFRSLPAGLGVQPPILAEMADLQALSTRYPFARRAISILHFLAQEWGSEVSFSENMDGVGDQDKLCRPIPGSMNFFCPDFEAVASRFSEPRAMALFLPFPKQGLPLLVESLTGFERTGLQLIG
jgi:hypothetical protein